MTNQHEKLISALLLFAGILHFVAIAERSTVSINLAILYGAIGLAQIILAVGVWVISSRAWIYIAAVSSSFLILLFVINELLVGTIPGFSFEPLSTTTIIRKALEAVIVIIVSFSGRILPKLQNFKSLK